MGWSGSLVGRVSWEGGCDCETVVLEPGALRFSEESLASRALRSSAAEVRDVWEVDIVCVYVILAC